MSAPTFRCAVYTRKSSEEGLEQAFNSLDAQREAGLDYIKSQKHQGWTAITTAYDDGGFSGGNVERPGLKHLLDDIQKGRVDVVVVYKVDRLSRSLADFARLMQLFDERKVSFVPVTQQFNTTTSMGRLTLNMLLSFAQFEREVTGERIRDKIAATKRKGVWVCGQPPLGYRVSRRDEEPGDRRLRIVESEAAIVRAIFAAYLELHSPIGVTRRMKEAGHTTRRWTSSRKIAHGGLPFTPQVVYDILTNPTYVGKIRHTRGDDTEFFTGLHEPIIDQSTWDKAQARITTAERTTCVKWTHTHLLKGKIRTFEGHAMSPSSISKKRPRVDGTINTKRVPYYCSQKGLKQGYKSCPIKTINATQLDNLVRALLLDHLHGRHSIDLRALEATTRDRWIREAIHRVILAPGKLTVEINPELLDGCRTAVTEAIAIPRHGNAPGHDCPATTISKCLFTPDVEERDERIVLTVHIALKRHDNRHVLLSPDGRDLFLTYAANGDPIPQPHLVRAIGQAFTWHRELLDGSATFETVAKRAKITPGRVTHLLHLTRLGPAVVRAVLTGEIGPHVALTDLHEAADHLDWSLQAAALGLSDSAPQGRTSRAHL